MSNFVIITNDTIAVTIPTAIIPAIVSPVPIIGSSANLSVDNLRACLMGDELPLSISTPLNYTTPSHSVAGMGKLSLELPPANTTAKTKNGNKSLLLKGSSFTAKFQVTTPATMPPPASTPDPELVKVGTATFATKNTKFLAS